ncbi:MAG: ArnT family glycosyltransferase [Muribaculaceae bacterium]
MDMLRSYSKPIVILALSVVSLLLFLGMTEFYSKGEPREAIVAVTMLDSGNWVLPTNNGGDMAYKPPFFHWCIAAISSAVGEVNEYTSRFPSAVALVLMTLATFCFYAKRRGWLLAAATALILLTNFEVHRAGVACRVDMVLTACIVIAMYSLYRWCERSCKGFPVVAVLMMSAAVLTKGPVGMILPCLVTGVYMLVRKHGFWLTFAQMCLLGIASLVLPLLWYYAAYKQGGQEFLDLVMEENFGRFMGTMSYESHVNAWHYNVIMILGGFAPYTLLAAISLCFIKGIKMPKLSGAWQRFRTWIDEMDNVRLFSLLAWVLVFVFYCIPKSKRGVYLLPLYPFMSYFMAELLLYLVENKRKAVTIFCNLLFGVYSLLFVLFVVLRFTDFEMLGSASEQLYLTALRTAPLGFVQWLLMVLPIALFVFRKRAIGTFGSLRYLMAPALVFVIFMATDSSYQPIVLNAKANRESTDKIISMVPQGPIYSYLSEDMLRFFVINFYSGNRVLLFENEKPNEGHLLLIEKDAQQFIAKHPQYEFKLLYSSDRKGCDVRDYVQLYEFTCQHQ